MSISHNPQNNPQLEKGYTRISNEILDALCKYHPGFTEGQIIWAILRKTFGWNKKSDRLSISQIQKMTGKSRRMVIYALKNLEGKKMIVINRNQYRLPNEITFQKNYNLWIKGSEKSCISAKNCTGAIIGKKVVQLSVKDIPKVAPTKDTYTKDTIQKTLSEIYDLLVEKIKTHRPNHKLGNKEKDIHIISLMISADKRDPKHMLDLVKWYPIGQKFIPEIFSAAAFREKFDRLDIAYNRQKPTIPAYQPRQDEKICAQNIRQTSRGKRWCELEYDGKCDFAFSDVCRKYDDFRGIPLKEEK